MSSIYVLKSSGGDKMSDFIQVRDDKFMLMEYVSIRNLSKLCGRLDLNEKQFKDFAEKLPFNKITEFKQDVD